MVQWPRPASIGQYGRRTIYHDPSHDNYSQWNDTPDYGGDMLRSLDQTTTQLDRDQAIRKALDMLASWTDEDKIQYILDRLTDEILQQQAPEDI